MAVDYKRYLAENVLNDRKTVTHRSLSRALKVHTHLAKQMLYEFHRTENTKNPRSVNATYVVTGVQKELEEEKGASVSTANGANADHEDEDEIMQSSPYISSSMPNQDAASRAVERASVTLVREEDLEDAKSTFLSISSIHIYSLQPNVLQDLNVLTDISREILAIYANEDPLEYGKQWGMIQNKNVKRRTGVRPPPPPAVQKETVPSKRLVQKDTPSQQTRTEGKKGEDAGSKQPSQSGTSQPSSKPTEKLASVKRGKSDIFSSFAKAKPKQKKENSTTPAASGPESAEPSGAEDVALDSGSEEEPEELFPDTGKRESTSNHETKKEREEKLRKMMEDDDDEEMPDAAESPEEEQAPTIDQPPKEEEVKEQVTVVGGRRRGRRQVMKKKTVKDEEGYLVTVEEPAWESFSEDEPAPPPKKKPAIAVPAKGKSGAKTGQGNIMSFFSKK